MGITGNLSGIASDVEIHFKGNGIMRKECKINNMLHRDIEKGNRLSSMLCRCCELIGIPLKYSKLLNIPISYIKYTVCKQKDT